MNLIIDRFERDIAVCEYGDDTLKISREALPTGAREGDVLKKDDGGSYYVDAETTRKLRQAARSRLNRLFSED